MSQSAHNYIVSFIWSIADDCLRDVYVRGKYRDVILPMVVLRRLDALLEESKEKVMEEIRFQKDEMKFAELDTKGLQDASGYVFYNTSKWTLQALFDTATNSQQLLETNFIDYLNGFSSNVKEIVDRFKLRAQIHHMAEKDVLLDVLAKFTSPYINLTNKEKKDPEGRTLPALSNLGMGYVFEELIRRFNEENNEEAGEHFTPREVIDLMTHLVFEPVKDRLPEVITIYDPACGSGGMLTESQDFITERYTHVSAEYVYLYGKEINDETYAICKSDMMIKGNNPEYIRCGSTLATDEFADTKFDFMLSNPPYGKSWASDLKYIKDGKDIIDPRFEVTLSDYWGKESVVDAIPRSSDGQLLFLMEMVSKMKPLTMAPEGSRIASVHNGSSLFTGDAGSGESNIRRYIIENDLLEAIIQMPNNLFYNTGITTYIWLLSNHKSKKRKGKVQLIDASDLYIKLRKNLGNKNCQFSEANIADIMECYTALLPVEKNEENKIGSLVFENRDFGYYKVTIERPKRLSVRFTGEAIESLRYDKSLAEPMQWIFQQYGEEVYKGIYKHRKEIERWCEENGIELTNKSRKLLFAVETWEKQRLLYETGLKLKTIFGEKQYDDFNAFAVFFAETLKKENLKLSASEQKAILSAVSFYNPDAEKVVAKRHRFATEQLQELLLHLDCLRENLPDYGFYPAGKPGEYMEYESESTLRDYENIPLKEDIYTYFLREVKPHVPEAWINLDATKIGYEISFNKYFYRHKPLRTLEEVTADIRALEQESDGLIEEILSL